MSTTHLSASEQVQYFILMHGFWMRTNSLSIPHISCSKQIRYGLNVERGGGLDRCEVALLVHPSYLSNYVNLVGAEHTWQSPAIVDTSVRVLPVDVQQHCTVGGHVEV